MPTTCVCVCVGGTFPVMSPESTECDGRVQKQMWKFSCHTGPDVKEIAKRKALLPISFGVNSLFFHNKHVCSNIMALLFLFNE